MTVFSGALDATFTALGIDAVYTPAGGDSMPVRVVARRPETIVGFGETRIHTETATFKLRASEVATHGPTISSSWMAKRSSSRASPSGATPIGSCGQLMCGRRKRLGAQVGLFRPSRTYPPWLPRRRSRRESSSARLEPRLTERRPPGLERQQ
jgi:hypothetical protein